MRRKRFSIVAVIFWALLFADVYVSDQNILSGSSKYSFNKINNRPCEFGKQPGKCMFVWECMKTKGSHIGMCTEGFMFGSCCSHDKSTNKLPIKPNTAYVNPYGYLSHSILSHNVPHNEIELNEVRPSSLPNDIHQSTTLEKPGLSNAHIISEAESESSSVSSTTILTHKTVTIKPPAPPTRPTRLPKPTRSTRNPVVSWWASQTRKPSPTKVVTDTTEEINETIITTASSLVLQIPEKSGPVTTNKHSTHVCGTRMMYPQPEGRIVNGTNSKYGEFPWQVSVRRISFFGFSSTHRCGGALLNSKWVATAGHCIRDLLTSQIRIRSGEYDFSSVLEPYPYVEKKVTNKVVHPNYNFYTYEYDLALVEMENEVEFHPHIQPICLPGNEDLLIGEIAKVTGWGRLSEHGTLPSILQQTSVPVISNEVCKNMFLKSGRKEHIPEIFLCAGYPTGGRDSCQGDSGGPLQAKGSDGRWFLAGIISWGIGCAEPNLPGVCTRISKFVPWILENVT